MFRKSGSLIGAGMTVDTGAVGTDALDPLSPVPAHLAGCQTPPSCCNPNAAPEYPDALAADSDSSPRVGPPGATAQGVRCPDTRDVKQAEISRQIRRRVAQMVADIHHAGAHHQRLSDTFRKSMPGSGCLRSRFRPIRLAHLSAPRSCCPHGVTVRRPAALLRLSAIRGERSSVALTPSMLSDPSSAPPVGSAEVVQHRLGAVFGCEKALDQSVQLPVSVAPEAPPPAALPVYRLYDRRPSTPTQPVGVVSSTVALHPGIPERAVTLAGLSPS